MYAHQAGLADIWVWDALELGVEGLVEGNGEVEVGDEARARAVPHAPSCQEVRAAAALHLRRHLRQQRPQARRVGVVPGSPHSPACKATLATNLGNYTYISFKVAQATRPVLRPSHMN